MLPTFFSNTSTHLGSLWMVHTDTTKFFFHNTNNTKPWHVSTTVQPHHLPTLRTLRGSMRWCRRRTLATPVPLRTFLLHSCAGLRTAEPLLTKQVEVRAFHHNLSHGFYRVMSVKFQFVFLYACRRCVPQRNCFFDLCKASAAEKRKLFFSLHHFGVTNASPFTGASASCRNKTKIERIFCTSFVFQKRGCFIYIVFRNHSIKI